MSIPHSTEIQSKPHQDASIGDPNGKIIQVRSFITVITSNTNNSYLDSEYRGFRSWQFLKRKFRTGRIELGFESDNIVNVSDPAFKLVLGDDSELEEISRNTCVASCIFLNIDLINGSIEAYSSIVGLPPIFVYKTNGAVIITSALHLLAGVSQINRELDISAITEILRVGYPLYGKTFLKNAQLLPTGNVLLSDVTGQYCISSGWNYPNREPMTDWPDFIDLQVDAFRNAVRRLDAKNSFLSLTGGLDTRTVFAALLERGIKVPASTITGKNLSLDARIAQSLCERYQTQHLVINLDQEFMRNLPELTMEASRLSGGLASLEQAHEVFFYRKLHNVGTKRISGNLGNQVGRGGVEGTSIRNADVSLLNIEYNNDSLPDVNTHWLEKLSSKSSDPLFKLLIQHEVPYTFVGNYSIGQNFATQQSPYANRELIETSSLRPLDADQTEIFRPSRARLKDLRHRFFGEDPTISFQQKYILSQGGYVAECPINWGWKVTGGISLAGLGMGLLAFCDAYSGRSSYTSKMIRKGLSVINADGMHIIKQYNTWLVHHMYDFVHDTLHSKDVLESGLLNKKKIDELLTEYFIEKKPRTKDLIAALDISLAIQHFMAR